MKKQRLKSITTKLLWPYFMNTNLTHLYKGLYYCWESGLRVESYFVSLVLKQNLTLTCQIPTHNIVMVTRVLQNVFHIWCNNLNS